MMGLPKAAEVAESPLDKLFSGASEKGKSLVALKDEAADRRRMLERASHEAGAEEAIPVAGTACPTDPASFGGVGEG